VPEKDAKKVMIQLSGIRYKGRTVRCNDADEGFPEGKSGKSQSKPKRQKKDNWRELMNKAPRGFKGEEPDFSEEGWAMRKPRKKKK
jgi:ATP-dependent RNA helicase DeaD